ncbi:hypothetical protein [Rhizobium sp. 18055]|uniref:hypothetical protein n=1 Tax=Rhizobium sp. 18055 TaxID=2681403 RepID=UPI0013574462|nr:hypothetical protein [Rhizobium sp. 18055]
MIGSLKWDRDGRREKWRASRLSMDNEVRVTVPLRYGRKSMSRDNTYTMVLDGEPGIGLLVPFKSEISNARALIVEAEALWSAEAPNSRGSIAADWGSVGALFQDADAVGSVSTEWTTRFEKEVQIPIKPITKAGMLAIGWPTNGANEPAEFDVILATATMPETKRPSPLEIATAWATQANGREEYFLNNILHGIRTTEDAEIWGHLRAASPKWLDEGAFAVAKSALDAEFAELGA